MLDVLIIVVVLVLIFGAGKLKSAGSDLGAAVKGFRKGLKDEKPARPAQSEPDAEFPEVLAAKERGNGKRDA